MKTNKIIPISLGIVVLGLLIGGIGFLCGGRVYGFSLDSNGIHVADDRNAGVGENAIYIEETIELEAFKNLEMDISFADVEIRESDHYSIEYRLQENRDAIIEMQSDTLNIKQRNLGGVNLFTLGYVGPSNYTQEYLILYVPKGQEFGKVDIDIDSGELKLDEIKADELKINNGFGAVSADKMTAGTLVIAMDSGDVKIDEMEAGTLTMDNSFGGMELGQANIGSGEVTFDSGDIEFGTLNIGALKMNHTFGSIDGKQLAVGNLILGIDSGDCKIADFTANHAEVENSFGSVEFGLREGVEAYAIDVEVEFGSIEVNGEDMGTKYKKAMTNSDHEISINSDSGNVTIFDVK